MRDRRTDTTAPSRGLTAWCLLALLMVAALCSSAASPGVLTGIVRDQLSGAPIVGARVSVGDAATRTDARGEFVIEALIAGVHMVEVDAAGYAKRTRAGVPVSAGRDLRMEIKLEREAHGVTEMGEIKVRAGRIPTTPRAVNSGVRMNRVRMQKEVGAAWDVQRIFSAQPGVTASSDMTNNLVVRGGNPSENQILVDHIELPTISHLSWQGESGGAIGVVNLDFVRDAAFYTGGFPVEFGGKLSSVLDIRFREGNRRRPGGEVELSMAGVGGGFEGPIGDGTGSWVASYRKSFLALLKEPVRLRSVPHYEDAHAKVVLDLSPAHRLSLLAIGGRDDVDIKWVRDADRAVFDGEKLAVGATWAATLSDRHASRVTLSHTLNSYDASVWQRSQEPVYGNGSVERETTFEAVIDAGSSYRNAWQIGGWVRRVEFHHRIDSEAWRGFSENQGRIVFLPKQKIDERHTTTKLASFVHRDMTLGSRVAIKAGVRFRRFTLTGATNLGPRLGVEYRPDTKTTLSLSGGLFHQSPTYIELTLDPANLGLGDAESRHAILGIERRLGGASKVRVEAYFKTYEHVPIFFETEGDIVPSGLLENVGQKRVRGVDLLLERRLEGGVFGTVLLTLSDAKARSSDGPWYPSDFDVRRIASIAGGVPLAGKWQISGKWRFVGGRPYTAFPVAQVGSRKYEIVPDFTARNQVRYPDYRRLDLRLDSRLDFGVWGGFLFFEIQNVLDRENVFARRFNANDGTFTDVLQFKRLGVVGVILDF